MDGTPHEPMPGDPKPDAATVPSSKWPWIVAGLVAMLLTLWNKIGDKDAEIQRLNNQVTQISLQTNAQAMQNAENALELARITKQLMEATNNNENLKDSINNHGKSGSARTAK